MGRYDEIHGDEDEILYEERLYKKLKDNAQEESDIEEWKLSRED